LLSALERPLYLIGKQSLRSSRKCSWEVKLEAAFAGLYAALVTPGEPHIGSLTDEEVGSMSSAYYIRAIADRSSLEGTAYVEVMAGAYTNRCWNDGSLRADLRSLRIHPNQHA
jgi:hypothetical protein